MAANKRKKDAAGTPAAAPRANCAVVGLGASAGGVEALGKFFTAMPADSGLAFVVLMHSDPAHTSLMPELLGRRTVMHVEEAASGTALKVNHVYVVPPGKYALLHDSALTLHDPPAGAPRIPVDTFFRSLAEDCNEKAIGIVLSGTGSEGALGLMAIRAHGGMTLAQAPETAGHAGMPRSAVATGAVDFVLPIEEMPARLLHYAHHPYVNGERTAPAAAAESPDHLGDILSLVRARTRRNFHRYKKTTLRRRIERRMGLNHVTTLADYLTLLRQDATEVVQLSKDLLIGVTRFFREPGAWEALARDFLQPLLDARQPGSPLRAWLPGCATGEEAYSLAIVFHELLPEPRDEGALQLFATDLNDGALAIARAGTYPLSIAADIEPGRLRRFFVKLDEHAYQISKAVRESIAFAVQDLTNDPPFSRLDLIVCRNLLIYLEADAQKRAVQLFHFALKPGGGLFLGTSEGVNHQDKMFEPVNKKWHIYRRAGRGEERGAGEEASSLVPRPAPLLPRPLSPAPLPVRRATNPAAFTRQLLLEAFAPAAVLIDRHYQVLYLHGPISRYLQLPSGEPTLDLTALAHDELGTRLRAALHRAAHDGQPVSTEGIRLKRDGNEAAVRLTVRPVKAPPGLDGGPGQADSEVLFLVAFEDQPGEDRRDKPGDAPALATETTAGAELIIRQLEQELQATREDLQSTIEEAETTNEELKASNEEIMSVNEELQSTNEELETAKEELQSLNEELNTVNAQLHDKVEDLESANNDLANLLACTDIATIFLDTTFAIKRFTPATARLVHLIPSDIGRPLSDIVRKFSDDELLADAQHVLEHLTPLEKEVRAPGLGSGEAGGERWYIRRILPYRTRDNHIEGVVVTFLDVTPLRQAVEQTRRRALQQSIVAGLVLRALQGEALPALLHEACRAVAEVLELELVGVLRLDAGGRTLRLEAGVGWKAGMVGQATSEISDCRLQIVDWKQNTPDSSSNLQSAISNLKSSLAPLLAEHGARSGLNLVIHGDDGAYGVLAAHTRRSRTFSEADSNFLQTTANVLAQALDQHRREEQLRSLNTTLEQRVAERTGLVRLLQDVAVAANEAETVEAALRYALRRVCEYGSWQLGHVLQAVHTPGGIELVSTDTWYARGGRPPERFRQATARTRLMQADCLPGQVLEARAVRWLRDISEATSCPRREAAAQEGLRGAIAFPVLIGRELTHVLEFFAGVPVEPEAGLEEAMTSVGAQLARVVERLRLQAQLSEAVWLEQRHLGQELHDTVGQELAGLALIGKSLADRLRGREAPEVERATQLAEGLQTALSQLRNLAQGLFPTEVDEAGLATALAHLATQTQARYNIACTFDGDDAPAAHDRQAVVHLFYIAREAVANAVKHSRAKHVSIRLEDRDGRLRLVVQDDGVGLPAGAAWGERDWERRQGMGLRIMHYRAALVGADLELTPVEGGGTMVRCTLRQEGTDEPTGDEDGD